MENNLLYVGLGFIAAAIIGGGLKAFGVEVPVLKSLARQIGLGVLGLALVVVWLALRPEDCTVAGFVFDENSNTAISGVHIGLSPPASDGGQVVADNLDTTGIDGKFSFACPKSLARKLYPLSIALSHSGWVASVATKEKVEAGISRAHVNIPVQLSSLLPTSQTLRPASNRPNERTVLVSGGLIVRVIDLGPRAVFELITQHGISPSISVDVNQNGSVDTGDVVYAVRDDSTPCTVYLLSEKSSTICGMFKSQAQLKIDDDEFTRTFAWDIPKSELAADGNSVHFIVKCYNEQRRDWSSYPSSSYAKPFVVDFDTQHKPKN